MRVDFRRGLFRLWIIASIVFMVGVTLVEFESIRQKFQMASLLQGEKDKQIAVVASDVSQARGIEGTDYLKADESEYMCWYRLSRFRDLYPEYKNLSDKELLTAAYKKASESRSWPHPWEELFEAVAFALGIPVLVLGLAYAFGWAFAGFRPSAAQGG